jgi:hypothetical protein
MKKSSEYKSSANFALLLIGPPKSGKTALASSFPLPAILDCDSNLAYAARNSDFLFENPNVEDGKEIAPAQRWKKSCDFLREAIALPDTECRTIVIDGLTIMGNYLIDSLSVHSKLTVGGEKVMDQTLWQPFRNKITQFILQGRASNKMFIMTCHEDIIRDETSGAVIAYRPLIPGQLKQNLAGLFSDCWRTETKTLGKNISYLCRVAPKNQMQIGNSLGLPKQEFDLTGKNPSQIWNLFNKHL